MSDPRILARIASVNAGLPRQAALPWAPGREPSASYVTAIAKVPAAGAVAVTAGGVEGDAQADRKNHGGPEKAVHAHFAQHLAWWGALRGRPVLPGEIGENLTLEAAPGAPEADEAAFCIGDVLAAGGALLQVTGPRIPCFKQAAALGIPDAVRLAAESGRTGLYLRVLRAGTLRPGDVVCLLSRPHPGVTVAEANRFVHGARDPALRARLAACAELGRDVRRRLGR